MFRCNRYHQGAHYSILLKYGALFGMLTVHHTYTNKDLITYAATLPN
jgi:hypothetical protein